MEKDRISANEQPAESSRPPDFSYLFMIILSHDFHTHFPLALSLL